MTKFEKVDWQGINMMYLKVFILIYYMSIGIMLSNWKVNRNRRFVRGSFVIMNMYGCVVYRHLLHIAFIEFPFILQNFEYSGYYQFLYISSTVLLNKIATYTWYTFFYLIVHYTLETRYIRDLIDVFHSFLN